MGYPNYELKVLFFEEVKKRIGECKLPKLINIPPMKEEKISVINWQKLDVSMTQFLLLNKQRQLYEQNHFWFDRIRIIRKFSTRWLRYLCFHKFLLKMLKPWKDLMNESKLNNWKYWNKEASQVDITEEKKNSTKM